MTAKEVNANREINENNQTEENKDSTSYSMNLAIIGGVVGAGVGLLASPETGKKAIKNLGESEFVKTAGKEFKKTAQELLARQAEISLKQLAAGYVSKMDEGLLAPEKANEESGRENSVNDESQSSKYDEIKEENKNLNDRLQRIEEMLNNLVNSK